MGTRLNEIIGHEAQALASGGAGASNVGLQATVEEDYLAVHREQIAEALQRLVEGLTVMREQQPTNPLQFLAARFSGQEEPASTLAASPYTPTQSASREVAVPMAESAKYTCDPLKLELVRVEFRQIKAINQINQTFSLRTWLQFVIRDGGSNEQLMAGLGDDDVKPPFKSARWYASQLQWLNASEQPNSKTSVNKMNNDINIILEVWLSAMPEPVRSNLPTPWCPPTGGWHFL